MMSGCGILTNGKGTRREYCEFSLDELQVRVGHSLGHSPGESPVCCILAWAPQSALRSRARLFFFRLKVSSEKTMFPNS